MKVILTYDIRGLYLAHSLLIALNLSKKYQIVNASVHIVIHVDA